MNVSIRGAVAALALAAAALPAAAADLPARTAAPLVTAADAWSPWQIRVRAIVVAPNASARWYDTTNALGRGAGAAIPGAGAKVSTSVMPEIDISYFFTKNIAVEAICCVSPHTVKGTGTLAGLNVGRTWAFPPTLLLQYHFVELGASQPYVGVGVNYTHYFGTREGNGPTADLLGVGGTDRVTALKIKDSWGLALQAGFDYMIDRHWGINVDVKKIWMQPNATGVVTNSLAGPVPVSAKVKIDPWIVGAGVTYRF